MTIEERYAALLSEPSDIQLHLPKLRELASQVDNVCEFGVRTGRSTVALLAGRPKIMRSYDVSGFGLASELEEQAKPHTDFHFVQQSTRDKDIGMIQWPDLLFIDTLHTRGQLFYELYYHAMNVRRYVVLHDTATFGLTGEDGGAGINFAWQPWARAYGWKIAYETAECNGLTVLERTKNDH